MMGKYDVDPSNNPSAIQVKKEGIRNWANTLSLSIINQ